MSLEQFASCAASRRGLRTVQCTTKERHICLIEVAAPSDFLLLGIVYKFALLFYHYLLM